MWDLLGSTTILVVAVYYPRTVVLKLWYARNTGGTWAPSNGMQEVSKKN